MPILDTHATTPERLTKNAFRGFPISMAAVDPPEEFPVPDEIEVDPIPPETEPKPAPEMVPEERPEIVPSREPEYPDRPDEN